MDSSGLNGDLRCPDGHPPPTPRQRTHRHQGRVHNQITASAGLPCQKPGPLVPAGVSAPLQLRLNQINCPLLKMKGLKRRAGGPAVPERDTLERLCPAMRSLSLRDFSHFSGTSLVSSPLALSLG